MIEGPIKKGEVFTHLRSGADYTILFSSHDENTVMKIAEEGSWEKAIVYQAAKGQGITFIRDEITFRKYFERVKP